MQCNGNCSCDPQTGFAPVCDSAGTSYFSACHAGCTEFSHEVSLMLHALKIICLLIILQQSGLNLLAELAEWGTNLVYTILLKWLR